MFKNQKQKILFISTVAFINMLIAGVIFYQHMEVINWKYYTSLIGLVGFTFLFLMIVFSKNRKNAK